MGAFPNIKAFARSVSFKVPVTESPFAVLFEEIAGSTELPESAAIVKFLTAEYADGAAILAALADEGGLISVTSDTAGVDCVVSVEEGNAALVFSGEDIGEATVCVRIALAHTVSA